jgi:hypothetical protein
LAARKKPDRRRAVPEPRAKAVDPGFQTSSPEIRVAAVASPRSTDEDITVQYTRSAPEGDAPEIVIGEAPAGRETLSAIAEELALHMGRSPQTTLPYGDRISNAPGAKTPKSRTMSSAPDIVVTQGPAGRSTLSAIEEELTARDASSPMIEITEGDPDVELIPDAFEVFEMATFVVRGREIARLSSEALRRRFVEDHLLHRLPAQSMDRVDRVDVTPWTARGTVVVRVWCRVPEKPASAVKA